MRKRRDGAGQSMSPLGGNDNDQTALLACERGTGLAAGLLQGVEAPEMVTNPNAVLVNAG